MTEGDATLDDAVLLAGPTRRTLEGSPASLVLRDDGRIGYAAAGVFLPLGEDEDLQRITVNGGEARGSSVISLEFGAGEVRETVTESATTVSRRLRDEGYAVSAQTLGAAGSAPAEQSLEGLDGTAVEDREEHHAAGSAAAGAGVGVVAGAGVAARRARPTPGREPEPDATATLDRDDPPAQTPTEGAVTEPVAAPTSTADTSTERKDTQRMATEPTGTERKNREPTDTEPDEPARRRRPSPAVLARAGALFGRGFLSLLRLAVLVVGGVVSGILIIYVLMVLLKANPANGLVKFFKDASKPLAWQFKDLFTPRTRRANITENYGLAAVVYLVVTVAIARVLASIGKKTQR